MGVKFGEIDAGQIVQNEFKIRLLERLLEYVINNSPTISRPPTAEFQNIREQVLAELQSKYPQSGIKLST